MSYYVLGCFGRQRIPRMITAYSPNVFEISVARERATAYGATMWWIVSASNAIEAIRIARGFPAHDGRLIESGATGQEVDK
jgi:hypothetical protein